MRILDDLPGSGGPPEAPVRLRATDHTDLVLLIPYLLGYHPYESLVLSVLVANPDGGASRLGLSARLDLPPAGHPEAELAVVDTVVAVARKQRAAEVVLIAYGSDGRRCARVLDRAAFALHGTGVAVRVAIHADGTRWWSRLGDPCPPEGVGYDVGDSPLVAEAVLAGCAVRGDRAAVARSAAGPPARELPRLRRRLRALQGSLRDTTRAVEHDPAVPVGSAVARALDAMAGRRDASSGDRDVPGGPGEDDLLGLALLVAGVAGRDAALVLVDRPGARQQAELWQRVVAVSPPELAAGPLCVLAVAAWQCGDGTLARCCVDRVLESDPVHRLAGLIDAVLDQQLPPETWGRLTGSSSVPDSAGPPR
ncbi:hypothetical protein FHX74_003521 [Friedmanniella endophytica]|uniref:DUF4192 domain-containing protein n=1 Tax=Microlunatus kandeliicorticis TaxID=1759536 RepID=A0A7W3IVI3_9ACTN|nr:DUF4192 domain-containing protein [Microlunatus kandeliicorticis]MBA8795880.1 hypothetical protein [Microlunatus kandeliicorticis]